MEKELLNDFIRYVKVSTQSDDMSTSTPSTLRQLDLAKILLKELKDLGLEALLDEYGRVYASLEGNPNYDVIGLCSHMDTALECSGENVKPQIISNYDLSDIKLGESGYILSPKEFPYLNKLKGKTIITTSGDTLLGGDDKAGVAIIMNTIKELIKIDKDKRHPMRILFTPDEEIGRGPEHFNTKLFNAKYAYTVDGDNPSYISIENFNAASIDVTILGKSIHPGDAKDIMVNSILVAHSFMDKLPKDMIPAKTSGREGFNHIVYINGEVEKTTLSYILRNHDKKILESQIEDFKNAKEETLKEYKNAKIDLDIKHQYENMYEIIKDHQEAKIKIEEVYNRLNIKYEYVPIRGGTDGARFSFLGVPTPNLGTGSYNHHGRFEYAVLEEMVELVKICKEIFLIK